MPILPLLLQTPVSNTRRLLEENEVLQERYIFVGGWGNEAAREEKFSVLSAVSVDPSPGNVYVVDKYNAEINKFTSNGPSLQSGTRTERMMDNLTQRLAYLQTHQGTYR